jgi:hypothetical protein
MAERKYKIKNHFKELEKYLKNNVLSGKAKELIEIGGKPTKLPKRLEREQESLIINFPKNLNKLPEPS